MAPGESAPVIFTVWRMCMAETSRFLPFFLLNSFLSCEWPLFRWVTPSGGWQLLSVLLHFQVEDSSNLVAYHTRSTTQIEKIAMLTHVCT